MSREEPLSRPERIARNPDALQYRHPYRQPSFQHTLESSLREIHPTMGLGTPGVYRTISALSPSSVFSLDDKLQALTQLNHAFVDPEVLMRCLLTRPSSSTDPAASEPSSPMSTHPPPLISYLLSLFRLRRSRAAAAAAASDDCLLPCQTQALLLLEKILSIRTGIERFVRHTGAETDLESELDSRLDVPDGRLPALSTLLDLVESHVSLVQDSWGGGGSVDGDDEQPPRDYSLVASLWSAVAIALRCVELMGRHEGARERMVRWVEYEYDEQQDRSRNSALPYSRPEVRVRVLDVLVSLLALRVSSTFVKCAAARTLNVFLRPMEQQKNNLALAYLLSHGLIDAVRGLVHQRIPSISSASESKPKPDASASVSGLRRGPLGRLRVSPALQLTRELARVCWSASLRREGQEVLGKQKELIADLVGLASIATKVRECETLRQIAGALRCLCVVESCVVQVMLGMPSVVDRRQPNCLAAVCWMLKEVSENRPAFDVDMVNSAQNVMTNLAGIVSSAVEYSVAKSFVRKSFRGDEAMLAMVGL